MLCVRVHPSDRGASRGAFHVASLFIHLPLLLLTACPAPPGSVARARENAQELNLDARFGRTELALEHVAESAREEFATHHRGWGSSVRIADVDFERMKPRGDHDVDIIVKVAWYRPEQQELLTTTVKQGWRDLKGWQLVSEERLDGAVGLLGEVVVFEGPSTPRDSAQFPTVRLGGHVSGGE
jgi:hypothetical protein